MGNYSANDPKNEFTAIIEQDEGVYIAYCAEIPRANGQGKTKSECLSNLTNAITPILENRHQDALRGVPKGASEEMDAISSGKEGLIHCGRTPKLGTMRLYHGMWRYQTDWRERYARPCQSRKSVNG